MNQGAGAVQCCIAGGGPAGMMLGLLLARAGVTVLVLEKHADFFRDFRGDTIHPSTLDVVHELGLLDDLLKLPHQEVRELAIKIGEVTVPFADFGHLPTRCRFLVLMPQWDFLDFLAREAGRFPGFRLMMRTEATGLLEESGRVVGVEAATRAGPVAIRSDLVVAADGRHSALRAQAGLKRPGCSRSGGAWSAWRQPLGRARSRSAAISSSRPTGDTPRSARRPD